MNYQFKLKVTLFDESKNITKKQEILRTSIIYNELGEIFREIFGNDNNYKFIDRAEATVSSIDNNKQLRLRFDDQKKYNHSLHFYQDNENKEYFTFEELKYISIKIRNGLERFLHYKIDEPIIYIETHNL
jgi:hypothetical protein